MTIVKYKKGNTWTNVLDLVYPVGSEVRGINIPSLIGGTWTKQIIKDEAFWQPNGQTRTWSNTNWNEISQWNIRNNDHGFFSLPSSKAYVNLETEHIYIALGQAAILGQSVGKIDLAMKVNGTVSGESRAITTANSGWYTLGHFGLLSGTPPVPVYIVMGSFDAAPHGSVFISAWSRIEIKPYVPLDIWKRTA